MRMIWILAVAVLVTVGCNNNDTEVTSTDQKTPTSEQTVETPDTSGGSQADPVFKDYVYPGSKLEDSDVVGGRTTVAVYTSTDDVEKVVEFYKQRKFQSEIIAGTVAKFANENPDGSTTLSVTVTRGSDATRIIMKLNKEQ